LSIPDTLSRIFSVEVNSPISQLNTINIDQFWTKSCTTLSEFIFEQENDEALQKYKTSSYWARDRNRVYIFKKDGLLKCKLDGQKNELILVPRSLEQKIIEFYHYPHHLAVKNLRSEIQKEYFFPKCSVK